ncbi:MAG TPA: FHA domain-containing protein [Pyrinomonadaceae bacterium]
MLSAKLIVSQPGQRSHSVAVAGPSVSVGRRPDNTICLDDTNVSKYHAVIEWRDDAYWLSDLGSSNGTSVNGERLGSTRRLRNNDLVSLGGTSTLQLFIDERQAAEAQHNPTAVGTAPAGLSMPASAGVPAMPQMPHMPHVPQAPHVPHMPQAPAMPVVPQPPAAVQKILGMPRALAASLAGLLAVGGLLGVLWGTGVIGNSSAKTSKGKAGRANERGEANAAADSTGKGATGETGATTGRATTTGTAAEAATPPVVSGGGAAAGAGATPALARTLAVQISQKSAYNFDPGFAALINTYVNEYRAAAGYSERAAKHREAIEREFVNVQGIQPPLVAYVLAMSQTKFVERPGQGIWNLPPAVVRAHSTGDAPADMSDPAAGARVAAAYVRSLLDLFERENFMYAVACYGMTLDEAGKVRVALESKDPTGQGRTDFWKMKNAGVVQGAQVERVARFFAAGIVCENPAQYGLKEKPFSSLY